MAFDAGPVIPESPQEAQPRPRTVVPENWVPDLAESELKIFSVEAADKDDPEPTLDEGGEGKGDHWEPRSLMELAGREVRDFLDGTAKACLEWGVKQALKRAADLLAPGAGAVVDALDRFVEVAQAARTVVKGSGEGGVTVGQFAGFDVVIDFPVGGSDGRVGAHLAPEGDSLFGGIELSPAREHDERAAEAILLERGHMVMKQADLSPLLSVEEPGDRPALIRKRAEQRLIRPVRDVYGDDVELVVVYDRAAGLVAWVRLSGTKVSWCIVAWRSQAGS
jgi:hypothetical protein